MDDHITNFGSGIAFGIFFVLGILFVNSDGGIKLAIVLFFCAGLILCSFLVRYNQINALDKPSGNDIKDEKNDHDQRVDRNQ